MASRTTILQKFTDMNVLATVKRIPEKIQEEEKLYKLARFVAILAVFSILLVYLSSLNMEMKFPRRQVASQTNILVNAMGINSTFYDQSITIPSNSPVLPEAKQKLVNLGMQEFNQEGHSQFIANDLHPEREKILDSYVNGLRQQGYRVYYSPALLSINSEQASFQVDIVPECVGWIGMFAVVALMIAYPDASHRNRFFGVIIAIPLMHLVNLVRLSTTVYAGWKYGMSFLNIVHDFLWKTLLIFWALFLWIFWVKFVVEAEDGEKDDKREINKKNKALFKH